MAETEGKTFAQEVAEAAEKAGITDQNMTPQEEMATEQVGENAVLTDPSPPKIETAPPPAPPKEEPKQPPTTVPLAVHIREREKHNRELAELRQQLQVGNQRLEELYRIAKPEPAPIDRTADPLGAAIQQMDRLQADLQTTNETLAQRQQAETQRQQLNEFRVAVANDEAIYKQQVPDVADGIHYIQNLKLQEYMALGLDQHTAQARVNQDSGTLAMHAFQRGESPAEVAYRLAVLYGYKKSAPVSTDAAAGGAVPVTAQVNQTLQARAEAAARQKGGSGAPAAEGKLTMAELASMDNEEFAKLTKGKAWSKMWQ